MNGAFDARAFRAMARAPTATDTAEAPSQVASHRRLSRLCQRRGGERHAPDHDAAPSRHRRMACAFHRLADEAEVVHRPRVERGERLRRVGH